MMSEQARQYVFDLPARPAMGRDDFFVSESNREAVAWLDRWPDWPAPFLILYGPRSSGKSHLVSVWQEQTGNSFIDDYPTGGTSPEAEETLFHTYNQLMAEGRHMLITANLPPSGWSVGLADLKSRLLASPAVGIHTPDDGLLSAVLMKLFSDRQIRLNADVLNYILPRVERSFEGVAGLVDIIDKAALMHKRKITIPFIREILDAGQTG